MSWSGFLRGVGRPHIRRLGVQLASDLGDGTGRRWWDGAGGGGCRPRLPGGLPVQLPGINLIDLCMNLMEGALVVQPIDTSPCLWFDVPRRDDPLDSLPGFAQDLGDSAGGHQFA